MIHILVEKNYQDNMRFTRLTDGICAHLRRRSDLALYNSVSEIPTDARPVILISQSMSWSQKRISELCASGFYPLVFGHRHLSIPDKYSSLTPDYTGAAYKLLSYIMSQKGRGRVAVLGYNGDSMPDRLKYIGIKQAASEAGVECELFKNHGNVRDCLSDFIKRADAFDIAVCCNDNVAVALTAWHPEIAKDLSIGSCSASKISEFFKNPYPVCRIDYFAAGEVLYRLADFISRDDGFSSTVMTFDMKTDFDLPTTAQTLQSAGEVDFYGDGGLYRMERLDLMLEYADECDLKVLSGLISGLTNQEIADLCFMAEGTVKYRTKKLFENADVKTRRELIDLLTEFGVTEALSGSEG